MARTVQQIYNQILAQKTAEPALAGLNSPSVVAIYRLWMWLTAVSQAFLEQVLDLYKADIKSQVGKPGIGTRAWMRDRFLEFQTGYNLVYSNGVLTYSTIDTTAQIISRCSVTQQPDKVVLVKVATMEPPQAFTALQLSEISFYGSTFGFAGTQIRIVSLDPDRLYIKGSIYYNGQIDLTTIKNNVLSSLNDYCKNLSNGDNVSGCIILDSISKALQSATGVKYIKLEEVGYRPAITDWTARQILYSLSDGINISSVETVAGYIIGETDPGHTFGESITYIPA